MIVVQTVYFILALAVVTQAFTTEEEWRNFKIKFNKTYINSKEEQYRFSIFTKSLAEVKKHNEEQQRGLHTYTKGINQFSDLLSSEVPRGLNGTRLKQQLTKVSIPYVPTGKRAPDSIDWRDHGIVTDIKDQGACGSCWAFSAVGSIEAYYLKQHHEVSLLSEQSLVDCTVPYGNIGCAGGWMNTAFDYILNRGGIPTQSSYPYEATDAPCRDNGKTNGAALNGYVSLPTYDEEALKDVVGNVGPVSTTVNALDAFSAYSGGILYDPNCVNPGDLNHAVLVIGYGNDLIDGDYWLVKNSWGTLWGEDGFFKIARNKNSHCAIATVPSYPLVQ